MKKFCGALFACLLLLALSSPAWAQHSSDSKGKSNCKAKYHKPHNPWQKHYKVKRYKIKVLHQFREIKHKYNESVPDAQQMFLDYVGASGSSNDEEIQKIKDQYEQQIAELNDTIASLQKQLTDSEAAHQAEIDALNAQHTADLTNLENQLNAACDLRIEDAYNNGVNDGSQQCSASIAPLQLSAWATGGIYPYGIDTDAAGNMIVLDKDAMTVVTYDAQGNQTAQWGSSNFGMPVDSAVDSQGNVFVLDAMSGTPLQKYSSAGAAQSFTPGAAISNPSGLFIDSHDMIYVTDLDSNGNGRIQVFDPSGNLVTTSGEAVDLPGEQFKDVAVDEVNQLIYVVTDFSNVARFDMNGNYQAYWWGDFRTNANGIAIGKSGQVFIADTFNDRIQQYDANGNLQVTIGGDGGLLYRPYHISVDALGRLFIADYRDHQILMYQ